MKRVANKVGTYASGQLGAGVNYVVQTLAGVKYVFWIDRSTSDLVYCKSTDGGLNWNEPITVRTGTVLLYSIWYDRWSGISGDLIHIAYSDTGANDILYRNLDAASSDTLSSETTVFNGASAIAGGALTITRGRNGDLRVAGSIDAGTEDGAWSSTDVGATWSDTIADPSEGATQDQYFLLPGWNSDTADVMLIFVDASANGLSVKRYDDSGNSWAESTIIADGSFVDLAGTNGFPNLACVVDLVNSRNIVAAWTGFDGANIDLRLFFINDTTITESSTNVVLNSVDDQQFCALALETVTGDIYVFYFGKSDGSETMANSANIYYKFSTDDGATWSSELQITPELIGINQITTNPRFVGEWTLFYVSNATADDFVTVLSTLPLQVRARTMLGLG